MKQTKLLSIIRALSVIICLVLAVSASAYDFVQNGIYYNVSGTNATVTYKDTNFNSYSGTVNIPATVTYNGTTYTVATIGANAFQDCSDLIRVVMPNTVRYISNRAFYNCSGLTNITIPASMYTMYASIFDGCNNLKSVICLSESLESDSHVGNGTFTSTAYANATLYVPKGTVDSFSASTKCWGRFSNIKEIDCDFVEDAIFYNHLGSTDQVEVTYVERFQEDYSGDVIIPTTLTHDGNTYTVTRIGAEAFYNCYNVYSINIPSTVNYINIYAFYSCYQLTKMSIPNGVPRINYCTFGGCIRLQEITIPSSVTYIDQNAFTNCSALSSIICRGNTPPTCYGNDTFYSTNYTDATLYVPSQALSSYQSAPVWQNFSNIVAKDYDFEENGIYYIITGPNTASVTYKDKNYNSYSGTVNIPTTVTHEGNTYTVTAIGTSAFRQCDALTSVSIPNTVTVIGYASFYKCSALTSLTIPNSVLTIEDQALRESGLVQITIGNQVTSIGNGCFYNCQSLTSVNIPNSVTTLGTLCFQDCAALQSATLGTGLTTIPQQCFTYCEALSSISIPSNVDVISAYAFYDTGLTSISLTEGLDSIYYGAFGGCESLTSITFPASVSFIDDLVLEGCYSLAEIIVDSTNPYYSSLYNELYNKQHSRLLRYPPQKPVNYAATPSSCVQIDAGAYSGAVHLESITIGPNVTQIGVNAFEGCTGLIKFIVPEENTHYMADDGVLYTKVDGNPQSIIKYPAEKPGKHYSLPNTTDTIAIRAFERTSKLESVYIPSSVKAMASAAFENSAIKRVVIDEGLKIIPDYAFYTCANLESVYLPSTITSIGYRAFYYSVSLAEMTIAVNGQAPAFEAESFYGLGYYTDNRYATVYVPSGMASQYEGLNDWLDARGDFTDISSVAAETEFTVDSLKYITTDANLNVKVDDVTSKDLFDPGIPPKVAYQGNLCTVTLLGDHSLANCTRMIRAEVPFTATVVDGYAFYGSTPIEKMTLHEGLQRLSQFSLSHINGLTSLTIPASVDSISGTFVTYSDNLSEILVKDGNAKYTSVNGVLFTKNKKLLVAFPHANSTDYTVPYGTTVIGDNSFRGAKTLHSVDLPNSLQEIQYSAFTDNIGLTSITVPTGVTVIGNSAFSNCTGMTSAELPSTLTALGYLAFHNTPNLTTLTVKNPTPPTCEVKMDPRTHTVYYVFDDSHYSSVQLIVPRGSKAAYQAADTWKNFTNIIEADFAPEYKRGDVNNDNSVDIDDVTQLISYVLGNGNSINQYAADVNEDGGIDIDDITVIINYILNGVWPEPADIDMWYLIGDHVGFSPWLNTPEAIGIGLIPLYPSGEFNASGRGLLTYTGYFSSTDYLMLIHRPGYWEERWGIDDDGQFCIDEDNNGFHAETSGYYTIRLNTVTNELSFTPYTATNPGVFTTMAMPGNHNGWVVTDVAFNMGNINTQKENHDWMMQSVTFGSDDELKFAADNAWEFNWGSEEFPYGTGIPYGMNIPVVAGTYDIFFNDITGQFNFISK